jgi:hypothetical protein
MRHGPGHRSIEPSRCRIHRTRSGWFAHRVADCNQPATHPLPGGMVTAPRPDRRLPSAP